MNTVTIAFSQIEKTDLTSVSLNQHASLDFTVIILNGFTYPILNPMLDSRSR